MGTLKTERKEMTDQEKSKSIINSLSGKFSTRPERRETTSEVLLDLAMFSADLKPKVVPKEQLGSAFKAGTAYDCHNFSSSSVCVIDGDGDHNSIPLHAIIEKFDIQLTEMEWAMIPTLRAAEREQRLKVLEVVSTAFLTDEQVDVGDKVVWKSGLQLPTHQNFLITGDYTVVVELLDNVEPDEDGNRMDCVVMSIEGPSHSAVLHRVDSRRLTLYVEPGKN